MKKYLSLLPFIFLFSLVANEPLTAQTAEKETVYITRTGEKYHTSSCRYIKQSGKEISLTEAVKSYQPCKVCKPSASVSGNSSNTGASTANTTETESNTNVVKKASVSSGSVQCSGTTKAGNRCKRKTTSSNGRCYQH